MHLFVVLSFLELWLLFCRKTKIPAKATRAGLLTPVKIMSRSRPITLLFPATRRGLITTGEWPLTSANMFLRSGRQSFKSSCATLSQVPHQYRRHTGPGEMESGFTFALEQCQGGKAIVLYRGIVKCL